MFAKFCLPAVERLLVGAGVEEDTRARLVDVEGSRGLGANGFSLLVELEEAVGEEQSTIIVLRLCDVRSTATPTTAPCTSITSNAVASSAVTTTAITSNVVASSALVATAAAAVTTTTARLAAVARPVAAITTVEAGVVVRPAIVATASVSSAAIALPALLLAAAWTTSRFLA